MDGTKLECKGYNIGVYGKDRSMYTINQDIELRINHTPLVKVNDIFFKVNAKKGKTNWDLEEVKGYYATELEAIDAFIEERKQECKKQVELQKINHCNFNFNELARCTYLIALAEKLREDFLRVNEGPCTRFVKWLYKKYEDFDKFVESLSPKV